MNKTEQIRGALKKELEESELEASDPFFFSERYTTKEAIEKLCKAIRSDTIFDDTAITCVASMLLNRGIKEEAVNQ